MSLAARFDAWLTTDPASLQGDPPFPGEEGWPRCACGAWLRLTPDRMTYEEQQEFCHGTPVAPGLETECGKMRVHEAHMAVVNAWGVAHRVCHARRGSWRDGHYQVTECGHDNEEVVG